MEIDEQDLLNSSSVAQAVAPVQKEADTRKVVHPWYKADVMERHPAAEEKPRIAADHDKEAETSSSGGGFFDKISSFGDWLWGLVFPSNENEEADPQPTPAVPKEMLGELDRQDFQQAVNEMRHLVSRIRDFNEQLGDELAFEKLLAEMYKAQIEERISEGHNHWESLERDLKEKRTFNKERLETMEKLSSRESSDKNWSQFTKFANALGIGAAGLAVGSNPVSIAVFLVGVGLAADSIMDDWTKKQISSLITDDSQQQEKYTSAMQLGAGICSVAIFAGLASAGNTGVFADVSKGAQVGFNSAVELAQGGAAIGGGVSRYNSNIHQADMKEINDKIDKKSEDMKKDSGKMKSLVENVQQYYRNLSDIQRAQLETATAMIKA